MGRKYLISIAQNKAEERIKSGKQSTSVWALRAGKAWDKSLKLFFSTIILMQ